MQDVLHEVLAHRLTQPRPEAHIAPGAEHRPQKIAFPAQVLEQVHEHRHRAAGHPEGQHVAEGDALHPGLQQGNFGQHFVLQRGQQVFLIVEMVVEGTPVQIGPLAQVVHRDGVQSPLLDERDKRPAQGPLRAGDAPILARSGRSQRFGGQHFQGGSTHVPSFQQDEQ